MIMKSGNNNNNNNNSNNTQLKSMLLKFEKKIIILYLSLMKFENRQLMKCIHKNLNEILSNYRLLLIHVKQLNNCYTISIAL